MKTNMKRRTITHSEFQLRNWLTSSKKRTISTKIESITEEKKDERKETFSFDGENELINKQFRQSKKLFMPN